MDIVSPSSSSFRVFQTGISDYFLTEVGSGSSRYSATYIHGQTEQIGFFANPQAYNITSGSAGLFYPLPTSGISAASNIAFAVRGAEKMRIIANGNVGIGTTTPTALLNLKGGHIRSEQTTAPTVAVTTANGITAAAIAANSTDMKGAITTTGTNGGTNTVLTITFNTIFTVAPTVIITPANSSTQACTYFVSSTTTTFVLNFKDGGATPSFNYMVIE